MNNDRNEVAGIQAEKSTYLQFTAEELIALHCILSSYDVWATPSSLHSTGDGAEKLEQMQKKLRRKVKAAAFLFSYSGSFPIADHYVGDGGLTTSDFIGGES